MNKENTLAVLNCSMDSNLNFKPSIGGFIDRGNAGNFTVGDDVKSFTDNGTAGDCITGWQWWRDYYYPQVIRESYPVYIQERAKDKGKQAFEIAKILRDKKLINVNTVKNFVELMDELIKIL